MRALVLLVGLLACSVQADEFQPLTVRIAQTAGNVESGFLYTVETRIPNDNRLTFAPKAAIDSSCKQISENVSQLPDRSFKRTEAYRCASALHGTSVQLDYGVSNPGLSTLISAEIGEGSLVSIALPAHISSWTIPEKPSTTEVAQQYGALGFEHLLTGFDHLLFVACLLFICLGRWRHLFITITAFTIAHSLSLGLNAFGYFALNVRAIEAIIALSIVYLASDIIRHTLKDPARPDSLSYRYPASVAGGFGLLHGLGFANILNEFGLPQGDKLVALFSFNLGIEIGQLVFIAALVGVGWLLSRLIQALQSAQTLRTTALASSYVVGTIAMFWTIERIANVV